MRTQSLRKINSDIAAYFRQISIRKQAVSFDFFENEYQWHIWAGIDALNGRIQIEADWGGARCFIRFDEAWVWQMTSSLLGQRGGPELDETLRQIVLETAFSELTTLLEATTRKRFSVLSTNSQSLPLENWFGFGFSLDDGEAVTEGEIWVESAGLGYLANALRNVAPRPTPFANWAHVPAPLQFQIGWTDLPPGSLADLTVGDVVLLDECWIGEGNNIGLNFGSGIAASGIISGTVITVTKEAGAFMQNSDEYDSDSESEDVLDEINVRIHFDLGERVLSFAELRLLEPGYVFELGRDLRKAVTIRVNGKAIGEGELVDVDGQTGVAILRLNTEKPPINTQDETDQNE